MNLNRATCGAVCVALTLLAGCDSDSTAGNASKTTTSGAERSSSAPPTTPAPPETVAGYTIVADPPKPSLEPGDYALPPVGPTGGPLAGVHVPAGYASWGPFVSAIAPPEPFDPLAIGLWVVTGVYKDPCEEGSVFKLDDSVASLSHALSRQSITTTSTPRPTRVDGYDGVYLELAMPPKVDFSRCDDSEFNFWAADPGGNRWVETQGMVDHLWILDVDGQTTVLDLAVPPSATKAQIASVTQIVRAVEFVPAPA